MSRPAPDAPGAVTRLDRIQGMPVGLHWACIVNRETGEEYPGAFVGIWWSGVVGGHHINAYTHDRNPGIRFVYMDATNRVAPWQYVEAKRCGSAVLWQQDSVAGGAGRITVARAPSEPDDPPGSARLVVSTDAMPYELVLCLEHSKADHLFADSV